MESSTILPKGASLSHPFETQLILHNWDQIVQNLSIDLETTARTSRALVRKRAIQSASDLLRLVLMYSLNDWSLRSVGAWACLQEVGYLSDVAVLNRLRNASPWLKVLIGLILAQRCDDLEQQVGVQIQVRDATVVSRPGSQGTDWRIHFDFNLGHLCLTGIEITDQHGGESLARFQAQEGKIVVGDRGYCCAKELGPLLQAQVGFVIRTNWQSLPLFTASGQRFNIITWLQGLSHPQPAEQELFVNTPQGRFGLRLLAMPLSPSAAEEARRKASQRYRKKGKVISPSTWLATGFVLLVTNLTASDWAPKLVFGLYRLRWQIELLIKRLKSLLQLDQLRAQDPELVQTYLLGNLLAALLVDQLIHQVHLQAQDWWLSLERPLSVWRITDFFAHYLRQLVQGTLDLKRFWACLPALGRYFCDTPRSRPQQLAWARAFLDEFAFKSLDCKGAIIAP